MKMRLLSAALLTATLVGCNTTPKYTSESDKFQADEPIATSPSGKSAAAEDMPTFAPGMSRVDPEEIDESNYKDSMRRLTSDVKRDRAATAKVGR